MYDYNARVVRVVDGDTVELDVDCGFHLHFVEKFRVARINAPELGTTAGVASLLHARELLPVGAAVKVMSSKRDTPIREEKYGRWLAEIILPDGRNFSDDMIDTFHAVPWA